MAFDYKKEYKEFYMPKDKPSIVTVPPMNYIAVRGKGDPNQEDGDYKRAIGLLYGIAFTIKMSKKGDHQIEGYFDYVVPPLEGFWWQDGITGVDYSHKDTFNWISVIRLPDFVTREDFDWAVAEATKKKKEDFSKVEFFTYEEGLCVQCMHIGSYDDEPATVDKMHAYMKEQGCELDITAERMHHEIYLSDARKVAPEKLKTVIRHPIIQMI
ncbi:MAG: GyrI-like domain-containing protein [Mogibacterium sp.]|nr:GyrI-like domain-containing protein [Mogibacterium sp.]